MPRWGIAWGVAIALGASSLFAQESPARFRIRAGTSATGWEVYQIQKTAGGFRLTGKSHIDQPGRPLEATQELTLTPDWTFVHYQLDAAAAQRQVIEAARDGDQLRLSATVGGQTQSKSLPWPSGAVILDNLIASHYQVLLQAMEKAEARRYWTSSKGESDPAGRTLWVVVPQAMAVLEGHLRGPASEAGGAAEIPAGGRSGALTKGTLEGKPVALREYSLRVGGILVQFWADSATNRLMRIYVPVQDVELVREGFARVPETTEAPPQSRAFVERELTFSSGKFLMPATLCLPATRSGRVPIVVLVHGSGPNDRDETIGPNKPFRDLAYGLAAAGIATLRYDKRTFAFRDQIDPTTISLDDEVTDDAVAALRWAAALPEADPQRLFLLGHSLGATMAPLIIRSFVEKSVGGPFPAVRGAILMAATGRPLDEIVLEQTAFQLKATGQPSDQIAIQLAELRQAFMRVRSGAAPDSEFVFYAPAHYWRELFGCDTRAALSELQVPVLALQGGKDVQVTKTDYDLVQQSLAAKPANMFKSHWFPNLNHLFIPVEGEPTGAEYGLPGHIDPQVIQTISTWIHGFANPN